MKKLIYYMIIMIAFLPKRFIKKNLVFYSNIDHLAIYLKGGIGDAVMLLPAINSIKYFCRIKVSLFAPELICAIMERYNLYDEIIEIKNSSSNIVLRFFSFISEVKLLQNPKYDLLFFPPVGSSITASLLCLILKNKIKIGFSNSISKKMFELELDFNDNTSIVYQNMKLLDILSIKHISTYSRITSTEKEVKTFEEIVLNKFDSLNNEFICIYPHTKNKYTKKQKIIPQYFLSELVVFLSMKYPKLKFVFIGNLNDSKYCKKVIDEINNNSNIINLTYVNDIFLSIVTLQKAKAIIGIDGGMMHIAQCFDNKKVTFWVSTKPELYGYQSKNNLNIIYKSDSFLYINTVIDIKSVSEIISNYLLTN